MKAQLIGLHGPKQSGKDATYLAIKSIKDNTTTRVVRDAFADRLKLSACRLFYPNCNLKEAVSWANELKQDGWRIDIVCEDDGDTLGGVTGRQFLQYFGTEAHRQVFDTDFWIDAVLPDRDNYDDWGRDDITPGTILVVTDVRFPNEAEAIREAGGEVWRIRRPSVEDENDTHASEKPLPDELVDVIIDNSLDLSHLRNEVYRTLYGRREYDDSELPEAIPQDAGTAILSERTW